MRGRSCGSCTRLSTRASCRRRSARRFASSRRLSPPPVLCKTPARQEKPAQPARDRGLVVLIWFAALGVTASLQTTGSTLPPLVIKSLDGRDLFAVLLRDLSWTIRRGGWSGRAGAQERAHQPDAAGQAQRRRVPGRSGQKRRLQGRVRARRRRLTARARCRSGVRSSGRSIPTTLTPPCGSATSSRSSSQSR